MFSGIIADIGSIKQVDDRDGGLRLVIATGAMDLSDVQPGDSVAVNGVCLTVVKIDGEAFCVDVSRETLECTEGLDTAGAPVNLEKALCLADRLGGHLVSGHVDGVGEVVEFADLGESWKLVVRVPQILAKYIAVKGSITINGVSLTINQVDDKKSGVSEFSVNLIPHTLLMTNLKNLRAGGRVNLEVDMIARYVERMMLGWSERAEKEKNWKEQRK
ncbi:MAG: riboflavin synthase [Gallionella sp.]